MSRVKNISGGPLDVPMLDRRVEAGEVVDVPDFQPAHTEDDPLPIVWPPDKWEPVAARKAAAPVIAAAAPEPAQPGQAPPPAPPPAPVSSDPRERR